jgi:hypothetical protein
VSGADDDLTALVKALDQHLEGCQTPWEIERRLTERAAVVPGCTAEPAIAAIATAMRYGRIRPTDMTAREREGPWGPMVSFTDGTTIPDRLETIDLGTLVIWRRVAEETAIQPLKARLSDLCWCRRAQPRPDLAARSAIRTYLDMAHAAGSYDALFQVDDVQRALEIARELGDGALTQEAELDLLRLADAELAKPAPAAGVALRALQALVANPSAGLAASLDGTTRRALEKFEADPWHYESAAQLRRKLLKPAEALSLDESVVDLWVREAEGSGPNRLGHLQHALELAKTYGFTGRVNEIRVQIQGLSSEDMGLFEASPPDVDRFVEQFVSDSYLRTLTPPGVSGDSIA